MLDLTGIDAAERPELKHLAAQSARSIENALTLTLPAQPAAAPELAGPLARAARTTAWCAWTATAGSRAATTPRGRCCRNSPWPARRAHCSELFAQPWESWFDLARRSAPQPPGRSAAVVGPAAAGAAAAARPGPVAAAPRVPLRDVEIALIRKAVADARGNVVQAAQALGISRATVYRKLGQEVAGRHFQSAFGKNSCCAVDPVRRDRGLPGRRAPASRRTSAPSATFTCGCFAGFTTITPYWLNRRLSPSTSTARSPRFLKLSQVPRSVST